MISIATNHRAFFQRALAALRAITARPGGFAFRIVEVDQCPTDLAMTSSQRSSMSSARGPLNTLDASPAAIVIDTLLPSGSVWIANMSLRSRNLLPLSKCTSPSSRFQQDVIEAAGMSLPIPPPPEFTINGCKYGLDGVYISGAPSCPYCAGGGGGGSLTGLVVRCKRDSSPIIPVPSGTPNAFPPVKTASS